MKRLALSTIALSAALVSLPVAGFANTDEHPTCLSAGRVDHTEIVDDNTILFHMKAGDKVWRNTLVRKCSGLKFNDGFAYSVSGATICKGQPIRVINTVGGSVCSLGAFSQEMPKTHTE